MNLFQTGEFTLASGKFSSWKVECDALTLDDWKGLAVMAVELFGHPSKVVGVPHGGIPFADALQQYCQTSGPLWIVDDVLTTGGSMEEYREGRDAFGVVAFARGVRPLIKHQWIHSIWTMSGGYGE